MKEAVFLALAVCCLPLSGALAAAPAIVQGRSTTIGPSRENAAGAAEAFRDREPELPGFSVKELGPVIDVKASSSQIIGQGGNYAVSDGAGGLVWFLNNIWTGELPVSGQPALWGIVEGGVAVSGSSSPYSLKGALKYSLDENQWPLSFLAPAPGEYIQVRKFWPRAGLKAGDKYYAFYSILNNFGSGLYDYFRVGQGLAVSADPAGPYKQVEAAPLYFFWNDVEPAFGSAVLPDSDGWLYVYGRAMTEPGKYSAALARVRPGEIESREKYEYYSLDASSGEWTGDLTELTPVMENMPEEFSVSYNDHLKSYLALYLDPEDREVLLMRADYPWGQWKDPVKLMACAKEEYCSGAKEQTAFSIEGGQKIFFTLEKKNVPYIYELVFE